MFFACCYLHIQEMQFIYQAIYKFVAPFIYQQKSKYICIYIFKCGSAYIPVSMLCFPWLCTFVSSRHQIVQILLGGSNFKTFSESSKNFLGFWAGYSGADGTMSTPTQNVSKLSLKAEGIWTFDLHPNQILLRAL